MMAGQARHDVALGHAQDARASFVFVILNFFSENQHCELFG
jgi:hypothetical protein